MSVNPDNSPARPAGRSAVRRRLIRFDFVGYGERAPAAPHERLYLDVGGDLRPGVLDHHHLEGPSGSATRLVLDHPDLVSAAAAPGRRPEDPFTVVLHQHPDLDCAASAFLAIEYLVAGRFPANADLLAAYVDAVDAGALGMDPARPLGLYAAYMRLANRPAAPSAADDEGWRERVRLGVELVRHVLAEAEARGAALADVDAFACPGLFTDEDRRAIRADAERYGRMLADPRCHARTARLRLPGRSGGVVEAETLLIRDVQNEGDPDRCLFFKDWARGDAARAANGRGFVGLSVFMTEGPLQARRCIVSVTPASGATLRGLGALLDEAEAERRRRAYGVDDRATDPATGEAKPPRPGYGNADPWYDGRGHGYTIVDAPRGGTMLTAEEIEGSFVRFGGLDVFPTPLR